MYFNVTSATYFKLNRKSALYYIRLIIILFYSFQFRDATGDAVQTLRLRVPPVATLSGGMRVMNGSMLHRAGSLEGRATADMEIFLLNTVWLPAYNTYNVCACTILTMIVPLCSVYIYIIIYITDKLKAHLKIWKV